MNRNREVLDKESANSLSFGSFVAVFREPWAEEHILIFVCHFFKK